VVTMENIVAMMVNTAATTENTPGWLVYTAVTSGCSEATRCRQSPNKLEMTANKPAKLESK